eukprot:PhF_6_TR20508/c1_g1_i1/m.29562
MKTVQLFLLTFLTLCGLSVSQSSGSYYCSRLLTEITDNGMGMEQSMQWTYNEVNGTLSIMFKLVARLGWTGIGFSRPEYTGMDKAIFFIGYLYSDGVVHENGCVNPYLGVGNGHPERNLSSLAKSVSYWGTNFQRESNELLVTSITIDVNSFFQQEENCCLPRIMGGQPLVFPVPSRQLRNRYPNTARRIIFLGILPSAISTGGLMAGNPARSVLQHRRQNFPPSNLHLPLEPTQLRPLQPLHP